MRAEGTSIRKKENKEKNSHNHFRLLVRNSTAVEVTISIKGGENRLEGWRELPRASPAAAHPLPCISITCICMKEAWLISPRYTSIILMYKLH